MYTVQTKRSSSDFFLIKCLLLCSCDKWVQLWGPAPWKSHSHGDKHSYLQETPSCSSCGGWVCWSFTSPVASPGQAQSVLKLDLRACFVGSPLFWGCVAHTEYGCLDQRFLRLGFGWNKKRLASLILCFCHVALQTSCHPLNTIHTVPSLAACSISPNMLPGKLRGRAAMLRFAHCFVLSTKYNAWHSIVGDHCSRWSRNICWILGKHITTPFYTYTKVL